MAVTKTLPHVTDWIFDLDNTLYPRTCDLFAQVDKLITKYVMDITGLDREPARKLQKQHYHDHGTTLNGLMHSHDIDPDHYLTTVHDIDYSPVLPYPELVETIRALPGRKYIFTNADIGHAEAVLNRLGGADIFDGMFDIKAAGYQPKPARIAYETCFTALDVTPEKAVMFDDLAKNLKVPHDMGVSTVHVVPDEGFAHEHVDNWELERVDHHDHIHHVTSDLLQFLRGR